MVSVDWLFPLLLLKKGEGKVYKTVSSKDALISLHICDVCKREGYAVYVVQLDRWYCFDCIQTACTLLRASRS
jgi:hypothetical protein